MSRSTPSLRQEASRPFWRDPRFVAEAALAILITVVVYVQTERIARQADDLNRNLVLRTTNQENVRFVRETVTGDSLVMPFASLDISYGSFRGLHFGCTDAERVVARQWSDQLSDTRYTGVRCTADFSDSNLQWADFQGAQLYLAVFEGTDARHARFFGANVSDAFFSSAHLTGATFDYARADGVQFQGSDLTSTTFRKAVLTGAEFVDTNLTGADFSTASLTRATFTNVGCDLVVWPEGYAAPSGCSSSSPTAGP